jgi:uncharacterized protein (TIRG00374 family)
MRRYVWVTLGIALGAALLWYSLRGVSLEHTMQLLGQAEPVFIIIAVMASFAFLAVKTVRWTCLLQPLARVAFRELHAPVYAGTAANLVISHVGELVRVRMLSRKRELSGAAVLVSIGVERVLDMFAMLLLLGYVFLFGSKELPSAFATAAQVAAVLAFGASSALVAVMLWPNRCAALLAKLVAFLPSAQGTWIQGQFRSALDGIRIIGKPSLLVRTLMLSLAQWLCIALGVWCCLRALGIPLDGVQSIATLVLLVVGLTLPTAPGYVGTTQVAFVLALGVFGVGEQVAFAGSVLYTTCVVLPPFIVGVIYLLLYFRPGSAVADTSESRT